MKGMHITIPEVIPSVFSVSFEADVEEPLEIALPDPLELPSLTADNVRYCASPFPHALQLMILAGRIANVYNRPDQNGSSLQALRQELHVFHRSLPPNLVWTNENFRAHVTGHQAVGLGQIRRAHPRVFCCSCTSGVGRALAHGDSDH